MLAHDYSDACGVVQCSVLLVLSIQSHYRLVNSVRILNTTDYPYISLPDEVSCFLAGYQNPVGGQHIAAAMILNAVLAS